MSNTEPAWYRLANLPPLPEPAFDHVTAWVGDPPRKEVQLRYSADQLLAYGDACAAAAREALLVDAKRWRWWRNRWPALCRMDVARFAGLDLSRVHVQNPDQMDAVTDAAMAQKD